MTTLYPDALAVEHISRFTTALASAAENSGLATPIPTCGDWLMADLISHLSEVQNFWIHIIENRPTGGPATYDRPTRPVDDMLVAQLRNGVVGLVDVLGQAKPDDAAWSWAAEQTVGFTVRRQIHEALTHCIDGVLAAKMDLPEVSPQLAADGIDEIVHVMLGAPDDAAEGTITLETTDTNDQWTVAIGTGDAVVSGASLDINLWMWGRADTGPLTICGATDQLRVLRNLISGNTQ